MAGNRSPGGNGSDPLALHDAVLCGEHGAREAFCAHFVTDLRRRLSARFPRLDPDVVETAVHDALLKHLQAPARFDSQLGDLTDWLFVMARNAVFSLERKAGPRRRHEVLRGLDLADLAGPASDPDAEQRRADAITWYRTEAYRFCWSDEERRLMAARLAGASPVVRARALGLGDLPLSAARKEIDRVWDRIMARLRRR